MRSITADLAAAPLIRVRDVVVSAEQARIHLRVSRPILFTSELPGFDRRLLQRLPLLWSTICHNEHGLSFAEELRATEMGHVVEHVVLALLTEQGIYAKGMTEWNWLEDPEGTFTITLYDDVFDATTVELAVVRALEVLDPLFHPRPSSAIMLPDAVLQEAPAS